MSSKRAPQDYNNQLMGQRVAPTLKDKEKINLLYHCPPECKDEKDVCASLCADKDRGGLEDYLRKNCRKSCHYCDLSNLGTALLYSLHIVSREALCLLSAPR